MRRKVFVLISLLCLCVVPGYSVAQQDAIDPDLTGLHSVRVRFCNDTDVIGGTKSVTLTGTKEQKPNVCLYLFNTHTEEIAVDINVVDGTITGDEQQKKACKDESEKSRAMIGQYASFSGDQQTFVLGPESVTQTSVTLQIPDHYAGKFYSCVTMKIHEEKTTQTEMFEIVNRRGYPFEVVVDGDVISALTLENLDKNLTNGLVGYRVVAVDESIAILEKNGSYYAYVAVHNTGNIAQDISIYEQLAGSDQDTMTRRILPGELVDVVLPLSHTTWKTVKMSATIHMTATPVIDFESEKITDDMRSPSEHSATISTLHISQSLWWGIGGLLAILFLVVLLLLTKRKKKQQLVTITEKEYKKFQKLAKKKKKKKSK